MGAMLDEIVFRRGHSYDRFLELYASPGQRLCWEEMRARLTLTPDQRELLGLFTRTMNVACLAGAWCGDCARQCPMLQHFALASDRVQLRYFDRDAEADLARELRVCGGSRVPVVVFLSEDFAECARFGDRTLSQYRRMAEAVTGRTTRRADRIVETDLDRLVLSEWLAEFERVQWMLRVSPRLRAMHGD